MEVLSKADGNLNLYNDEKNVIEMTYEQLDYDQGYMPISRKLNFITNIQGGDIILCSAKEISNSKHL